MIVPYNQQNHQDSLAVKTKTFVDFHLGSQNYGH